MVIENVIAADWKAILNFLRRYVKAKNRGIDVPSQAEKKSEFPRVDPIPAPVGNLTISKYCSAPKIFTINIAAMIQFKCDLKLLKLTWL